MADKNVPDEAKATGQGFNPNPTQDDRPTRSELAQSGYSLPESHFTEGGDPINTQEEADANDRRLVDEARARTAAGNATPLVNTRAAAGAPANKARTPQTENKSATPGTAETATGEEGGLDGVQFASSAARDAAADANLTASDFKRQTKSSESGFTKADVERISEK